MTFRRNAFGRPMPGRSTLPKLDSQRGEAMKLLLARIERFGTIADWPEARLVHQLHLKPATAAALIEDALAWGRKNGLLKEDAAS